MNDTPLKNDKRFLVHLPGHQNGRHFTAHEADIEPSGALGIYALDASGDRYLVHGFAPGAWREVENRH